MIHGMITCSRMQKPATTASMKLSASDAVTAAAAGLIAGGAIGNLVDRLRFGAVTDFIDLHWGAAHWPTFNLADAAIVCGVALLLLTVRGSDGRPATSTLGRAAR